MLNVLCDLIADINMRLPAFPIEAGSIHRLSRLEIGPGGACNVAIMAARLGLPVSVMGEVGDDAIGQIVLDGLKTEGIETSHVIVSAGTRTPLAGVLVDPAAEPSYLGYSGELKVREFQPGWVAPLLKSHAVYAGGWAEHEGVLGILLEAFTRAHQAEIPIFFDPGPGNPEVDSGWMNEAIQLCSTLILNEEEAERITGRSDAHPAAQALLQQGPQRVVVKRGPRGLLILDASGMDEVPGLPVHVEDTTGAGDSVVGAVIYGTLMGFSRQKIAVLANAAGAAKVIKFGTGRNLPTPEEIKAVLEANDLAIDL